jgi:hypothetical protein
MSVLDTQVENIETARVNVGEGGVSGGSEQTVVIDDGEIGARKGNT